MPTSVQTDWISPAQAITGRDHLAVQAVSEHLYAGLLPGLTNVTDRARCYAFYPWFVWSFDRLSKKKSTEELIRVFRRAECLHTLIGIVHELDEGDGWAHGAGLVGRAAGDAEAHPFEGAGQAAGAALDGGGARGEEYLRAQRG